MTQTVILENFIKYLELSRADYIKELEAEQIKYPQKKAQIVKQQAEYENHIKK